MEAEIPIIALERIRKKLIDLTPRNRLLNFKESARTIRVIDEIPDRVYQRLLSDKNKEIFLLPLDEYNETFRSKIRTPYEGEVLERRCKTILRDANSAIQETGTNLLFMAIGFLEWTESNDSSIKYKAPLILVPLEIRKKALDGTTGYFQYAICYNDEDIEANLSLVEKLKHDFGTNLPSFSDELLPEQYFEEVQKICSPRRNWRVSEEIVIGLFSFAKILLYKDLDPNNWPQGKSLLEHPNIIKLLGVKTQETGRPELSFIGDSTIYEEKLQNEVPLILDADSSQNSAIVDALSGTDMVIVGPPGTGKSQTITNLIAAAMYQGKSVLFITDKNAALDIVKRNLEKCGLGHFCLELHSNKMRKDVLFKNIKTRLEAKFKKYNEIENLQKRLEAERTALSKYCNLINSCPEQGEETIFEILMAAERWASETPENAPEFMINNSLSLTKEAIAQKKALLDEFIKIKSQLNEKMIWVWNGFNAQNILPGDEQKLSNLFRNIESECLRYLKFLDSLDSHTFFSKLVSLGVLRQLTKFEMDILSDPPEPFDNKVAINFATTNARHILDMLSLEINECYGHLKTANLIYKSDPKFSPQFLNELSKRLNTLTKVGYLNFTVLELHQHLQERIIWLKSAKHALAKINIIYNYLPEHPQTLDDLIQLQNLLNLIKNSPIDAGFQNYSEHASLGARSTFNEAKAVFAKLYKEIKELKKIFNLQRMPAPDQILNFAFDLKRLQSKPFAFLSRNLRKTKRAILDFLTDPQLIKLPDISQQIETLGHVIKEVKIFEGNREFKTILGPLFKGMNTDWQRLEKLIQWANSIRESIGSSSHAKQIVQHAAEIIEKAKNCDLDHIGKLFASSGFLFAQNHSINIAEFFDKNERFNKWLNEALKFILQIGEITNTNLATLKKCTTAYMEAIKREQNLTSNIKYKNFLNDQFQGLRTNVEDLYRANSWVSTIIEKSGLSRDGIEWLLESNTKQRIGYLKQALNINEEFFDFWDRTLEQIRNVGNLQESIFWGGNLSDLRLEHLVCKAQQVIQNCAYLAKWADYCRVALTAKSLGLEEIIQCIQVNEISTEAAIPIYMNCVHRAKARELFKLYDFLRSFTRERHEEIKQRYCELDKLFIEKTRLKIAAIISERSVPPGVSTGYVNQFTELRLLKHETNKAKRHVPIRQLMKRAYRALQALKPCFMMSPLSVAQFLEPEMEQFDLVIMDEASQLRPEEALGAIARAKQLVVVGDPNQLPPTSFFERVTQNLDDEEVAAIEITESILEICKSSNFPAKPLLWHYRSEHESLIAFSNAEFYDNQLIVFPSTQKKNKLYGVHSHYVENATYQKGRNIGEAQKVVQAIVQHFRDFPNQSLGVVTVNIEQQELIEDLLDQELKQNPWLDQTIIATKENFEPFFIKNLENVQGDERDVIFISTTYGPDPETKRVYQRFGPIAGETGWRRLNVLFTRAKKRIELFTSMRPDDIILSGNASRGVAALRKYLEYAKSGMITDFGETSKRDPDSDFEISVARFLGQHGYKVVPQVGVAGYFIDIGVLHPEREYEFILGIECDGASYHSAKSTRDRDRLRQEILEKKGWIIHRIWSTDWYKNRVFEKQRLLDKLNNIIEKQRIAVIRQNSGRRKDALVSDELAQD